MSDIALEFRGAKIDTDGSTSNQLAIVWEPKREVGTQALRLAKLFVMDLLERHGVTIDPADREQ